MGLWRRSRVQQEDRALARGEVSEREGAARWALRRHVPGGGSRVVCARGAAVWRRGRGAGPRGVAGGGAEDGPMSQDVTPYRPSPSFPEPLLTALLVDRDRLLRSEEHTSELQSRGLISY